MSSFKDRTGAVALPTLDADGNVPVTVAGEDDRSSFDLMLLELRAVRLGLEMQLELEPGELLALALES